MNNWITLVTQIALLVTIAMLFALLIRLETRVTQLETALKAQALSNEARVQPKETP